MRLAVAALAVLVGGGAQARAQAPPPHEASPSGLKLAQDLVAEGRALGQQGRWAEALERFQRAAGVSPKRTPQLSFYVGYAEARAGKLVAAQVDLRRAVELARADRNAQVLAAAEAELPELEARTPTLTITAAASSGAPASALSIDGDAIGVAALGSAVPLDPGEHTIVVRFATGDVTRRVALVERQRATVTLDAPAPAPASAPAPAPAPALAPALAPAPAPEHAASTGKTLGIVGLAAGGASLAAGGVFYALSRSAFSPVSGACPSSPCVVPSGSPLPSDYDDAKNKQTIAAVLASAGGAVVVTGLVLLLTGGSTTPAAAASPHVAPWIGAAGAGASLGGRF